MSRQLEDGTPRRVAIEHECLAQRDLDVALEARSAVALEAARMEQERVAQHNVARAAREFAEAAERLGKHLLEQIEVREAVGMRRQHLRRTAMRALRSIVPPLPAGTSLNRPMTSRPCLGQST